VFSLASHSALKLPEISRLHVRDAGATKRLLRLGLPDVRRFSRARVQGAGFMARKRVLVVDDEMPARDLLTNLLGRLGHTAEAASSAVEALSKIERAEFDLILTDFNMPGMKGDELAHEIKKRKQEMPVVLVTASPPENLSQDIDRVLLKPFSVQELIETIASLT